jgi:hypothetical protein
LQQRGHGLVAVAEMGGAASSCKARPSCMHCYATLHECIGNNGGRPAVSKKLSLWCWGRGQHTSSWHRKYSESGPLPHQSHQVLLGGGISGNPVIHQHDMHVCVVCTCSLFTVTIAMCCTMPIVNTSHHDSCFGVAAGKGTPSRRTADSTRSGSTRQELGQLHGRMQAAGKGMELRYRCTCSI